MGMQEVSYSMLKRCTKERLPDSHKGDNGRALIVAGSEDYVGAAGLAAMGALAALRTGIDVVVLAAPEKVAYAVNALSADVITRKFEGKIFAKKHAAEIAKLAQDFDAVLLGPGLGQAGQTAEFVREVVRTAGKPIVVDADAIKAVRGMKFKGNVLLTPHAEEFKICFGKEAPKGSDTKEILEKAKLIEKAARDKNCTILLKGHADVISDGKDTALNRTGNACMTVAGTGDVLAGICTAFASRGNSLFDSACAAAFVNGTAGDGLMRERGCGFVASDLVEKIPEIVYSRAASGFERDYLRLDKPWGLFEQFVLNGKCTVKILTVKPNQQLSLQMHQHRDEMWIAVDAGLVAEVGDKKTSLKQGDRVFIKRGTRHRLFGRASGGRVLEISLGFFDENDIVRLEDVYGRIPSAKSPA